MIPRLLASWYRWPGNNLIANLKRPDVVIIYPGGENVIQALFIKSCRSEVGWKNWVTG